MRRGARKTREPPKLTQARLKELVTYTPETGAFILEVSDPGGQRRVGDVLGGFTRQGTKLDGNYWALAKLAFLFMTGEIPKHLEYINRDRADNRWENLRALEKKKPPPTYAKQEDSHPDQTSERSPP